MPMNTTPVAETDRTYENVEPLFVHWSLTDPAAPEHAALRERIIGICLTLADNIARRFAGRGESHDDLIQTARVGLVMAVDRYDVRTGAPFLSFAVPTVMGEVRRHFRDRTWALHVPRSDKELHARIRPAIETLTRKLHRSPTAYDLAAELEVDVTDVTRALAAADAHSTRSIDTPLPGGGDESTTTIADSIGGEDPRFELAEQILTVAPLLERLTEEERNLLIWRYYESLTQSDIAARLGVSQMSVSRKLTRLLGRLHDQALDERGVA